MLYLYRRDVDVLTMTMRCTNRIWQAAELTHLTNITSNGRWRIKSKTCVYNWLAIWGISKQIWKRKNR
jgi:hypothetical protein